MDASSEEYARWLQNALRPLTKEQLEERSRLLAPLMQQAVPTPEHYAAMQNAYNPGVMVLFEGDELKIEPVPWWKFWKRQRDDE